jgi:hypothetical protein
MKHSTSQHRGTPSAPILEPLSRLTRRIQDTLYTHYGDAPASRRPACYNTLRELLLQASWYTTASSQEYHGGTDGYTLTTNIIAHLRTLRKPAYRSYLPKLQEYLQFCNPTSSEAIFIIAVGPHDAFYHHAGDLIGWKFPAWLIESVGKHWGGEDTVGGPIYIRPSIMTRACILHDARLSHTHQES